ncbi:hypothetical protein E2C01_010732 [Portunus trituberculatus]|uniref:Uncharacterized protein n=1 Tax=Portunus trituberculatus TaxID=210409 RepID=A0A5B7D9P2_PORTR|nr:hypothetical protein [Portunus trituberculatus]
MVIRNRVLNSIWCSISHVTGPAMIETSGGDRHLRVERSAVQTKINKSAKWQLDTWPIHNLSVLIDRYSTARCEWNG